MEKTSAAGKWVRNAGTFTVENGALIAHGPTAHLFYDGEVNQHNFRNFEFRASVMTTPGSNSGLYFHTTYQEGGWPEKGYEVQVNNSHTDWRRTGSLYGIQDIREVFVKRQQWFTEYIRVQGKNIQVRINDSLVMQYTEPGTGCPRGRQQTPRALQRHVRHPGA